MFSQVNRSPTLPKKQTGLINHLNQHKIIGKIIKGKIIFYSFVQKNKDFNKQNGPQAE